MFSIQFTQAINKQQQHELAYMPHRDDYEYEFDNDAEAVLSSLFMSPDDSDLDRGRHLIMYKNLKLGLVTHFGLQALHN